MHSNRTRRAGQPRPVDLEAIASQVAKAAGAPKIYRPSDGPLLDSRGWRRPEQCMPGHNAGRKPMNAGKVYPPNALTVEECFELLRACDQTTVFGRRMFFAVLFIWQGAFRVFEAVAVLPSDLDLERGRVTVRHGKGDKRRTVAIAQWAWPLMQPWLDEHRRLFPEQETPLLPVLVGPSTGDSWDTSDLRCKLHELGRKAGIERPGREKGEFAGKRCAPHQLRHSWAVQAYNAGVQLRTVQLHLGHANIGITDTYLRGAGADETLDQVYEQAAPMVPATAMLALSGLDKGLVPA